MCWLFDVYFNTVSTKKTGREVKEDWQGGKRLKSVPPSITSNLFVNLADI